MLKPEQIAHINILNWFKHTYPQLANDIHHFANERKTSYLEGRTLKRMGVMAGVYDFFLAYPLDNWHGLWLELKVNNGKLSKEQIEFGRLKRLRGYYVCEAWGEDSAKKELENYLINYGK